MALSCKLVAFTKNTGTGAQAVTGAGFTVKAVVLATAGATALTTFQAADAGGTGIGFLSSGAGQATAEASADGVVTSAAAETIATKAFRVVNSAGVVTAEATLTSLDADGFTINWTTNDGLAQRMYAWCIGGADLTNALAHTWSLTSGLGNKVVTGVGFAPDVVLFLRGNPGVGIPTTDINAGRTSMGAMDALGNQWALSTYMQSAISPSGTVRGLFTDCAITNLTAKATFVSMDADGYTLNVASAFPSTTAVIALALKGGTWKVGNAAKPIGAGPASQVITGFGTPPKGLLMAGIQRAGASSISGDPHAEFGLGFASGIAARGAIARVDRSSSNPTFSKRFQDSTKVFVKVDNGTSGVDASADLTSFDADGFTLSWNPNDAVATIFGWVAGGDAPAAPTGGNPVFDGYYGNRPFMRGGR